jgi:membrane-associated phospholipid phosphatase
MKLVTPDPNTNVSAPDSPSPFFMRTLSRRLLVVSIAATSFAIVPSLMQLDVQLSQWARQVDFSGDLEKTVQLSEAFAHGSGVISVFIILLWTDVSNRRRLWSAAIYVLTVGVLANVAKYFLPRLRPNSGIEIEDVHASWLPALSGIGRRSYELSFPSGHSATAVAFAIALSMVYPRGKWFFATLALMAIWQRIYCGAHYPSDCIAGAGVALAIASLWRFSPASQD